MWHHLADPDFYIPGKIGMLLGSDKFFWLIVDDEHNDNVEFCVNTNDEHESVLYSSESLPHTI